MMMVQLVVVGALEIVVRLHGAFQFTPGIRGEGKAAAFDGASTWIGLTKSFNLLLGDTSFTLATWFRTADTYTTDPPEIGGSADYVLSKQSMVERSGIP